MQHSMRCMMPLLIRKTLAPINLNVPDKQNSVKA